MKRITKIEIQNFQSHKNTTIEPTPGLTVIVGHTDSGKSAFIRALRWCLYNKQPKSQLINKDAEFASVKVTFSDDSSIFRYKSKNKKDNYYIVTNEKGEESTYTSVGNTPLKEVMDISGMYEVNMFNRDISLNMTDQFDSLFFLAENPTDKGTLISQMANTEVCDAAIAICSAKINTTKKLVTALQKTIKSKRESLAEYNYLEELKNVVEFLNESKKKVQQDENRHQSVHSVNFENTRLAETIRNIGGTMINISDIEVKEDDIEKLISKSRNRDVLASCCDFTADIDKIARCLIVLNAISDDDFAEVEEKLNALLVSIQAQQSFIMTQAEILKDIAKLSMCSVSISTNDVDLAMNEATRVTEKQNVILNIRNIVSSYEKLIAGLRDSTAKINEYMTEENNIKTVYEKALQESEICPVCGSIMDEEHLKHSVENL